MNRAVYERYAELKRQSKELDVRIKEAQDEVIADMSADGNDKVESDFGSFFFASRKTWTYPQYVVVAEADFKAAKLKAETIGEATYTESKSLTFKGKESDGSN